MAGVLPPPQPTLKAQAVTKTRLSQTAGQMRRELSFLRRKNSGSRRNGRIISAEDVLATVSAKTTVTWYTPTGVVDDVEIVRALVANE